MLNKMDQGALEDDLLAEMHAISCAAKPYATWIVRDGIQTVTVSSFYSNPVVSGMLRRTWISPDQ